LWIFASGIRHCSSVIAGAFKIRWSLISSLQYADQAI